MNGATGRAAVHVQQLRVTEDDSDNDSNQGSDGSSNSRLDRMMEKYFPDDDDDDSPLVNAAIARQAGHTTPEPTSTVDASQSSNPQIADDFDRGPVGMGVLMDALRRDAMRHADDCNDSLSNDGSIDSDDELEQWAQQIRGEIRDSEMVELALEAERAADAGEDHFVGHPSTFGSYPDTDSISSSKKLKPLQRRRAYTADTPAIMRMSPMRTRSEKKKLRVLALRNLTEVIPPIADLHRHLRAHMLQHGVAPSITTGLKPDDTNADRLQTSPPNGLLNSIKSWVSSKNSKDEGAVSPNSGRLSSLLVDSDDEHSAASHTDYEVGDTLAEHKRKIHSIPKPRLVRIPSGLILPDYDVDGDDFWDHREKVNDHETLGTVPTSSSSELGRQNDELAHTMTPISNVPDTEGRRSSGHRDPLPFSLDLETHTPGGDKSTRASTSFVGSSSHPGFSKEPPPPELPTLAGTPVRRERKAFGGLHMSNIGAWPLRDTELIPRSLLHRELSLGEPTIKEPTNRTESPRRKSFGDSVNTSMLVEEPFKIISHHLAETGSVYHDMSSTAGGLALPPVFLSNQTGAMQFPPTSVTDFIGEAIPVLAALEKVKSSPLDVDSDDEGPYKHTPVNTSIEEILDNSILASEHDASYVQQEAEPDDDGACSETGLSTTPKTKLYLIEERSPLSPDGSAVMLFGRQEANEVEVAIAESEKFVEPSFIQIETAKPSMYSEDLEYLADHPSPSMLYLIDDTAPLSPEGSVVMFLGRQEKSEVEVAIAESEQTLMPATPTQDPIDGASRPCTPPSDMIVDATLLSSDLGSTHVLPATPDRVPERLNISGLAGEETPLEAEESMNVACCHEENPAVDVAASHAMGIVPVDEQKLLTGIDQAQEAGSVSSHAEPCGCGILSRAASMDSLTALPLIPVSIEAVSPLPSKTSIHKEGDTNGLRRVTSCPVLPLDHGEMQSLASPMSVKGTMDTPARVGCLGDHTDSLRAAAMGVFLRMSPKREDHALSKAKDIGITHSENVAFLTNYLYCSKVGQEQATQSSIESHRFCGEPCGDTRNLDNPCGILGSGCHGLSGVIGAATFIFPTKQPTRDPLNLDPGTYRGSLHSETWFDAATERFDGAIDGAIERFVGSTREESHTWHTFQAPSLKVKTPGRTMTSFKMEPTEKVGGIILVKGHRRGFSGDSSKYSEVSETQWQTMYGIPQAQYRTLSKSEREEYRHGTSEKRGHWMTNPASLSTHQSEVLAVKRDLSPTLGRSLFHEP